VVAIREIEPGDELTHSYTDCALPTHQRQSKLQEIYKFTCSCSQCINQCSHDERMTNDSFKDRVKQAMNTPLVLRQLLEENQTSHGDDFIVEALVPEVLYNVLI